VRVSVIVTDDDGNTHTGEAELVPSGAPAKRAKNATHEPSIASRLRIGL
jgi:hypothetical protein